MTTAETITLNEYAMKKKRKQHPPKMEPPRAFPALDLDLGEIRWVTTPSKTPLTDKAEQKNRFREMKRMIEE